MDRAFSLGIIGGADGPTAVFVTGTNPIPTLLAAAGLIVAAILLVRHFRKP